MNSRLPYNDFSSWITNQIGCKVQRLPLDAGFSCPNRDGTISSGGCVYCNNEAFSPTYCRQPGSLLQQIEKGKAFFAQKYPSMKYLAYLQSYSNTHADLPVLKSIYEQILLDNDIVGIIIATRPDCVDTQKLDYLQQLSRKTFVMVEYGIESINDQILKQIHRGHDFACTCHAVRQTADRGIYVGGHVILGLPGENTDDLMHQAHIISSLPLDMLKIHQLQVIKNTPLAVIYERDPFPLPSATSYINLLAAYIQHLRPTISLGRFVSQSPPKMLVAPRWNIKSQEFNKMLVTHMIRYGMRQGDLWQSDMVFT